MIFETFEDYSSLCLRATELIYESLLEKPDMLFCASTGSSPSGVYDKMSLDCLKRKVDFSNMKVVMLDEWVGLHNEPESCEYYLREKIVNPLNIGNLRYYNFNGTSKNIYAECNKISEKIQTEGPIDVCLLGVGENGHIGFNEPNECLSPFCHISELKLESQKHFMIKSIEKKPKYGVTLGMSEILQSKKIILIIRGRGKKDVLNIIEKREITTKIPATFLWLNPNTFCLIDNESLT